MTGGDARKICRVTGAGEEGQDVDTAHLTPAAMPPNPDRQASSPAPRPSATKRVAPEEDVAVSGALNALPDSEFNAFGPWYDRCGWRFSARFNLCGYPVPVLDYVNWRLLGTRDTTSAANTLRGHIQDCIHSRENSRPGQIFLHDDDLLVFHDLARDRSTGTVAVVSPEALAQFLAEHFPGARPTPAMLRLIACYLGGLSLTGGAKLDGKSVETRKSQARELRRRLGLERAEDVSRTVGARLVSEVSKVLSGGGWHNSESFVQYTSTYLPDGVRPLVLLDGGQQPFRILDMGPKTGRPVIVLHAMILPDIRKQDIALLHELDLRLLWPLRNGLCAPEDPTFHEEEQIRHACQGIDIARRVFCEGKIDILSFAASSKIALAYARENRAGINALYFAASCVLEGRPESGVRRLAKGMLTLAGRNETLMSATMDYFRRSILTPERFPRFIRNQFRVSQADSRIVEAELTGPFAGERFRTALVGSIPSARHDFGFQRALDWEIASTLGLEMHFLHGDDDPIHPLPLIERLAGSLSNAQLHVIEKAGQLLYHEHLRGVLTPLADRIRQ